MKKLVTLFLVLGNLVLNAQSFDFKSSFYIKDGYKYYEDNSIRYFEDDRTIYHTNGFEVVNYPFKFVDFKKEGPYFVTYYVANITPENYDSYVFRRYGIRAFRVYDIDEKIEKIIELKKPYHSNEITIIEYYK